MDFISLSNENLSLGIVSDKIFDTSCTGLAIFIGKPKDSSEGRVVERVEYEAYNEMALNQIKKMCIEARKRMNIKHIAVYHKLGIVNICEASVLIGVSSEHSKDALDAVAFLKYSLKSSVPIWRKEIYKDGSPQWKYNKECRWLNNGRESSEVETGRYTIKSRQRKCIAGSEDRVQNPGDLSTALANFEQSLGSNLGTLREAILSKETSYRDSFNRTKSLETEIERMIEERSKLCKRMKDLEFAYKDLNEENESRKTNAGLLTGRLLSMKSSHQKELSSVVKNRREEWLARRFFKIWKDKAIHAPKSKLKLLELEVIYLRKELALTQEAAKRAFMRSANSITSEAVNLFNDAATRRLGPNLDTSNTVQNKENAGSLHFSEKRLISEGSGSENGENHSKKNRISKAKDYNVQQATSATYTDITNRNHKRFDAQSSVLRQETRNLMESLKPIGRDASRDSISSSSSLDYQGQVSYPTSVFHPDRWSAKCCCNGKSILKNPSCQYCQTWTSNSKVQRPKSGKRVLKSRPSGEQRGITFGYKENEVIRDKVIYQPSGSMVVIEKHLK